MEDSMPAPRRVQRVRHALKRREVEVASVERLGPQYTAVTFTGAALDDFVSLSFDDHLKLILPGDGDGDGDEVRRDYTPRSFDARRRALTIEFALHGEGAASDWARQAAPGQRVTIGGPRGSMIIPLDYDWHLLVGDATALPAVRRRLEELPAESRAIVVLQVPDTADRPALRTAARLELHWVGSDEALLQAVRELALPAGEGFAWCAGEAGTMARLRDVLLVEKSHPREAARIAAYWKRGASDHHENLG